MVPSLGTGHKVTARMGRRTAMKLFSSVWVGHQFVLCANGWAMKHMFALNTYYNYNASYEKVTQCMV
jgi:hypothetical protein